MCPQLSSGLNRRRFLVHSSQAAAVIFALRGAATSLADDAGPAAQTPQAALTSMPPDHWPNFRNGLALRGIAHTKLADDLKLKWEHEAPDGCTATPAIVDGRVYAGTLSGDLFCFQLSDGKEIWKYRSLIADDPKTFIPGFNSPVTVTDQVVLCGDDEGTLHCVDRETGKERWKFASEGLIVGGASVVDGRVIFGSHSQFLYGLKLDTGEKLWEFDAQGPINGTQVFSGKFTFVTGCSEPVLYVVDTETGLEHSRCPLDDLLIASPAIADDILYFGTSEGLVLALDWKQQTNVWKYELPQSGEVHSSPAVTNDLVVIGGPDKALHAIDRKTGERRWAFRTRASIDCSPVVVGDRVYFGSKDKFLYAVGLNDGLEKWKYSTGESFGESSPAVAEGRLVVCTNGPPGRILCFGP